jgi:hypothetical protein
MDSSVFFLGLKQTGLEADHPVTTISKVKETWIYISTPPYVFMS